MEIQYLVGSSHFNSILTTNLFNLLLLIFIVSEIAILIITSKNNDKSNRKDKCSFWVITLGIWGIVLFDIHFKNKLFSTPNFVFWIGLMGMSFGIIFRIWSVVILREFFTVSVQTNNSQRLIKKGPYKIIRHPAYSSTLLTIFSIFLCLRNYLSMIVTLIVLTIVYAYRINIEEKALINRFKQEYLSYKSNTYKLIPFIY